MPTKTSESHPIRVDWLRSDLVPSERLGITFAPGKKDPYGQSGAWDRDLSSDLSRLRTEHHVDTLICLLEDHELELLQIADLAARAADTGLQFVRFPIRDATAPSYSDRLGELVRFALTEVDGGRRVVVHCRGGLGRAGTFAAYCLVARGVAGPTAINVVRSARPHAIETEAQERSILSFALKAKLDRRSRFEGCLLGGAAGDALGAPIEFMSLAEIKRQFGPSGLTSYSPAYGRRGAITDDTQMTLFTAEGILRADNRWKSKGICHPASVVHRAYLRWLLTQGERVGNPAVFEGSWLLALSQLHSLRGPGTTCLAALRSGEMGSIDQPINDRKGCGGVMRIAPVGLALSPARAFEEGSEFAAITHGHPSGYLAAGFYAAVIAGVASEKSLDRSIAGARTLLRKRTGAAEVAAAVDTAIAAARSNPGSVEQVERLGEGWVAEEALAIALYCALPATSFADGVLLAVNHGGDSDSTGALTGGLLGALFGREAIPAEWLADLELAPQIQELGFDLFRHFGGAYIPLGTLHQVPTLQIEHADGTHEQLFDDDDPADWEKYPGY